MMLDKLCEFSAAQALTSTGSTVSTNVYDASQARDLGVGNYILKVLCQVSTTFTSGGAGTLQVQFQGSTDNSTFYTMAESIAYALAALTAGANLLTIDFPSPGAGQAIPRYFRFNYVIATAAMTAGNVNAYIILNRARTLFYPPGIAISN